jgi:hypothetical protein
VCHAYRARLLSCRGVPIPPEITTKYTTSTKVRI